MKKSVVLLALALALSMGLSTLAGAAEYVVKDGDVLWKIAKENGTTVDAIVKINGLKNANKIVVGQKLELSETATAAAPAGPVPIVAGKELNFPDQILPMTAKGSLDSISSASQSYYKAGTIAKEDLVNFAKTEVSFPMLSTVNPDGTPNAAIFGSGLTDDLKYVTFGMAPNTSLDNMKAGSMGIVTFYRYIHNEEEKFVRNRGFRVVVEYNESEQAALAEQYGKKSAFCKVLKFLPLG